MSLIVVYSEEDVAEGALVLQSIMVRHSSSLPNRHSILPSLCFYLFSTIHTLHLLSCVKRHVTEHDGL
jgi:hypothetical protein